MVALSREIERERECSFGLFPGCGRGGDGDTLPTRQCVPGFMDKSEHRLHRCFSRNRLTRFAMATYSGLDIKGGMFH